MKTFNSFDSLVVDGTVAEQPLCGLASALGAFNPVFTENATFRLNGQVVQPEAFDGEVRRWMTSAETAERNCGDFVNARAQAELLYRQRMDSKAGKNFDKVFDDDVVTRQERQRTIEYLNATRAGGISEYRSRYIIAKEKLESQGFEVESDVQGFDDTSLNDNNVEYGKY